MERDISWAENFKPIDEFQAIHLVEVATGWSSKKAKKWLLENVRSDRVGTLLKEGWGIGETRESNHKRFKDAGALEQLHISARDLAAALDEFHNECQEVGALLSRPPLAGTSGAPHPIKLTDGLTARRRVEEAAQWDPEAAQAWLCHALVAGRVRGWRAGSVKSACVPELDPQKYNIGFWEGMPISVNGGSTNFYLGTVSVDVASLNEALSIAFPREQIMEKEPKAAGKRGRPEKDFWPAVRFEAGAWLGLNGGEHEGGSQSALADFLMLRAEAHGGSLGRSQAMSKAKEMITVFQRLKSDGSL
jgi:hypothetical protein